MPRLPGARPRLGAVVSAALVAVALAAPPTPAAAAAGVGFTVAGGAAGPISLGRGASTELVYQVTDTSSAPLSLKVVATGLSIVGDAPQFTGSPSPGLTVTVAPGSAVLQPGATVQVTVTVAAAAGVNPGGLYGGVVFSDVPPKQDGQVSVVDAQARPLLVHIPGPTSDAGHIASWAQATSSSASEVVLRGDFADTGTIDYQISGTVTLSGSGQHRAIAAESVLPGGDRTFDVTFPASALAAGPATATLALTWGSSAEHHDTRTTPVVAPSGGAGGPSPDAAPTTLPPTFIPGPAAAPALAAPQAAQAGAAHRRDADPGVLIGSLLALLLLLIVIAVLLRRALRGRRGDAPTA